MKKLCVSSIVALALSSSMLVAEESGMFVGLGASYDNVSFEAKAANATSKIHSNAPRYEIIVGYNQFFTTKFGVRYYGNFSYADHSFTQNGSTQGANVLNYGVNVDALYNFIATPWLNLGAFLGVA